MDISNLLSGPAAGTTPSNRDERPNEQSSRTEQGLSQSATDDARLLQLEAPSQQKTSRRSAVPSSQTMFQFVDGSAAPKSARDRELAISQRRSFAAKNAHNRRKMQAMANQTPPQEAIKQEPTRQAQHSMPKEPASDRTTLGVSRTTGSSRDRASPLSPMSLQAILGPVNDDNRTGKDDANVIDGRTRAELVQRNRRYPSDLLVKLFRPPSTQVLSAFKHEDDRRTFDYWRARPAVEVTRYQMKYAHYWLEIFPRLAVSSSTIGHMVLAAGYAHESMASNAEPQIKSLRAISHYRKGLQAMSKSSGQLSELELLTAAFFAFTYEERQQNHKGAFIHLKGCEAMSKHATPGESSELRDFKEYINFILMCILISTERQAQEQASSFARTARSPEEILDEIGHLRHAILDQLAIVVRLDPNADAEQIRAMHTDWFTRLRQSERSNPETLNRNALFLLSNLFMGLCPPSFYGESSYHEDSNNWQGGLDTARLYLTPSYQRDHHMFDELDLLITIEVLAMHLAHYVPINSCREQAEAVLSEIEERRGILNRKIKSEI